jgi:hypothetical protein
VYERLKTQGLPLQQSVNILKNESEKLSVVNGEAGEIVSTKLQAVLERNPGYSTFTSVCQVLHPDDVDPLKTLLLRKFLR